MTADKWAMTLCVVVGAATYFHFHVSVYLLIACSVVALMFKRPWLILISIAAVASYLAANAWASLDTPLPESVDGVASVVRDPERVNYATTAEVKINGRHYVVWAYGRVGYSLAGVSGGDQIAIAGSVRPLGGKTVPSLRRRHVAGSINAENVEYVDHGSVAMQAANRFRLLISRSASELPTEDRSLLTGFVFGDDRGDTEEMTEAFRASGLSHLLAVSGENVAFLLLLAAPLLRPFSIRGRFVGALIVLFVFGLATRWEPSVVRAEMMALVALIANVWGRPISGWQCLGIGGAAAMLFDPFLVGSIGFLLSFGACIGMALCGEPIMQHLRGPAWLRRCVAYSASAQLGVLPIELIVFGGAPTVGLITNIAAEPLAAVIMVWGVVGGCSAGLINQPAVSGLVHIPTFLALETVQCIAMVGSWFESSLWGKCLGGLSSLLIGTCLACRRRDDVVSSAVNH